MSTDTTNAQEATSKSTETFLSALVLNAAIAGIELAAFLIIRNGFPRIYQPRVDLPIEEKRQPPLPRSPFRFLPAVLTADDEDIVRVNGLDAYLFVRFLKLLVKIFLPIACLTWVILLPVYGTSTANNMGMNIFTFGMVGTDQQARLWAPLLLSWTCTFYILYMIRREYGEFVKRRQDFLTSKDWSTRPQSRTVLLTGIPDDYCTMERLQELTDYLPGGVRKIWLARDVGDLQDVYDRRIKAAKKLESANNSLIKLANKLVRKKKPLPDPQSSCDGPDAEKAASHTSNSPILMKYITEKQRPTTRVGGKIPYITGKKVDTIDWATEELAATNEEINRQRSDIRNSFKPKSSAFILFNDQIAAHMFAQCLAHDLPLRMSGRYINVDPEDVIWNHTLSINPYAAKARQLISWAITLATCLFFSFPVAFVTSISNVSNLCTKVHFLAWLCQLPSPLNGVIQGILPPVALMLLFLLLPPFFKFLAIFEGTPLHSLVEHSLQKRYFIFLFIQGFIVATLSSGIMAGITQITNDPGSTVQLLAQNLPKASIFFLTLIVTSGLSGAAGGILQIVKLVLYYVKVILLGGSPRALWKIRYTMPDVSFGQAYPAQLLVCVISIAYCTIAPLVAGFATVTFGLYYFMFKYCFLWIYDQPAHKESGGLHFKTALNQMFAGIYISLLCLIGLFFLARDVPGNPSAVPQAALTIVLLVIVILFQATLHIGYSPLVDYLPLSMAKEMNANEERYAKEMAIEKRKHREAQAADNERMRREDAEATQRESAPLTPIFDQNRKDGKLPGGATALRPDTYYEGAGRTDSPSLNPKDGFVLGDQSWRHALQEGTSRMHEKQAQDMLRDDTDATRHEEFHNTEHFAQGDTTAVQGDEDENYDELGELHDHAFHHPALWKPQSTLWLPRDALGLSQEAVANARNRGIDMTDEDASINDKGKIKVTRNTLPGQAFP